MNILIADVNKQVIKDILPKVKFNQSSKHTSTFKVSDQSFLNLYNEVKLLGYNPYALMTW
mgnify:CR=1 FL=1